MESRPGSTSRLELEVEEVVVRDQQPQPGQYGVVVVGSLAVLVYYTTTPHPAGVTSREGDLTSLSLTDITHCPACQDQYCRIHSL